MGLKSTGITNLFVSSYGNYYWKAKINGKVRQGSLETKTISVAKSRLFRRLQAGKLQYGKNLKTKFSTLGDWAEEWLRRELQRPNLKPRSKEDYSDYVKYLKESELMSVKFARLNGEQCMEWWRELNERVAPTTANARLRVLKAVIVLAMEETGRSDNPSSKLKRKPVRRRVRKIPSAEDVRKLVQTIRSQRQKFSGECATMVEFGAYCGARPAEVAAIESRDIQGDWLVIRGGEDGTKNHQERLVPINKALREVIEREGFEERSGRLFNINTPTRALKNACERLGMDSVTPYTLRHFFATSCMEAGVDVATVADWMGHKDGGVLLLKTYTHVRRAHSLREAARLDF
jgi:integrase